MHLLVELQMIEMHGTGVKIEKHLLLNPLNVELNPICHLPAVVGAHQILHVSRVRVNSVRQAWLLNAGLNV